MPSTTTYSAGKTKAVLSLLSFLALVVGGGACIGLVAMPGAWYAALVKPAFNPPNWIFAPVWTALYVLIAIAGWRSWERARASLAMKLWWAQLALNWAWSPVFFSAHQIGAALVIVLGLLAVSVAFVVTAWRSNRIAALLFVPYAAWVAFASTLNAFLWMSN